MKKTIAVLSGDGIGPEIIEQSVNILKKIAEKYQHEFLFQETLIGAAAIDKTGNPFPDETKQLCESSDAILFGAIGDPKYDNDPSAKIRPEQGLLAMRKALGLYANVRPIRTFPSLAEKSPLKTPIIDGVDFVVIRELIGGIYFGKRGRNEERTSAFDTSEYTKEEIQRVARYAFEIARNRASRHAELRRAYALVPLGISASSTAKLTVVDKANVLETSRLWRETIQEMIPNYPDVTVEFMFVDNAAMQIIKRPSAFDVIVTENMFGDILTDEASVITGSIGMLPSASIGEKTSLYEPIHGSFPKAAGKNTANPIGSILSAAMMLADFGMKEESEAIEKAVKKVIDAGYGTADITNQYVLSTSELGEKIKENL